MCRDRPVPIPAPGVQLTSLSHVADVANMLAKVPGNKAAIGQHFNVCSDRCITLDGIAKQIAAAAGKEAKIVHYDPSAIKLEKGQGFPFRAVHFFASTDKAKKVLGWRPEHTFLGDIEEVRGYDDVVYVMIVYVYKHEGTWMRIDLFCRDSPSTKVLVVLIKTWNSQLTTKLSLKLLAKGTLGVELIRLLPCGLFFFARGLSVHAARVCI